MEYEYECSNKRRYLHTGNKDEEDLNSRNKRLREITRYNEHKYLVSAVSRWGTSDSDIGYVIFTQ